MAESVQKHIRWPRADVAEYVLIPEIPSVPSALRSG